MEVITQGIPSQSDSRDCADDPFEKRQCIAMYGIENRLQLYDPPLGVQDLHALCMI